MNAPCSLRVPYPVVFTRLGGPRSGPNVLLKISWEFNQQLQFLKRLTNVTTEGNLTKCDVFWTLVYLAA